MVELLRRDCIVRIAKRGGAMTGKSDEYTALVHEAKHGEGEGQDVEHCGECHSNSVDYDEVLDASPVSSRQWIIVAICGLGNATDAVEVLSMSYVLPVIELSTSEKGTLSSAVFAGMLAGAVVAGFCADRYGRKPILLASMLVNAACTMGFALSSHIVAMAALRFLTGCGVGGAVPVVFSLASEVMPERLRGRSVSIVASFWMLGSIAVALLAWATIPHFGWRTFIALCSLPAMICAAATFSMASESPRFLLLNGLNKAAEDALHKITNQRRGSLLARIGGQELSLKPIASSSEKDSTALSKLVELASPPLRRFTIILSLITACLGFGWYGLVMWMPSLFSSRHVELCYSSDGAMDCTYQSALIATASTLPGNMFAVMVMDRLSHKSLLASSGAIAAFAALSASVSVEPWQLGVAYCAFQACSAVSWASLDILSTESFPTSSRGTSMGLLSSIGRIAAILAQILFACPAFAPPSSLPMCCSTVAMVVTCACSLLLPSHNRVMQ